MYMLALLVLVAAAFVHAFEEQPGGAGVRGASDTAYYVLEEEEYYNDDEEDDDGEQGDDGDDDGDDGEGDEGEGDDGEGDDGEGDDGEEYYDYVDGKDYYDYDDAGDYINNDDDAAGGEYWLLWVDFNLLKSDWVLFSYDAEGDGGEEGDDEYSPYDAEVHV